MTMRIKFAAAFAALMTLGSTASAATISVISNGTLVAPPTSVTNAAPTSETSVSAFFESSQALASDLTTSGNGAATSTVLTTGTLVDSHLFYYNRDDQSDGGKPLDSITASFSFNSTILGFVTGTGAMNATDYLGAPFTTYDTFSNRGFEGADSITNVTANSFTVYLEITQPGDWFRVLTVPAETSAIVPLPAGAPLLLAGLGGLALIRRRRAKG